MNRCDWFRIIYYYNDELQITIHGSFDKIDGIFRNKSFECGISLNELQFSLNFNEASDAERHYVYVIINRTIDSAPNRIHARHSRTILLSLSSMTSIPVSIP